MTDQAAVTESKPVDQATEQEGQQQGQEAEEFEITIGDSPSQEDRKPKNPMVSRIIGQRDKARDESAGKDRVIDQLKQEIELLKRGHSNSPQPSGGAPKWEDYDDDAKYQQAVLSWAQRHTPNVNPMEQIQQYQRQQQVSQKLDSHYQRAQTLAEKFPEYSQAEQAAVEVLGHDLATEITARTKNSAELMLFFGKNSAKAREFKDLAERDPVEAALELGRLDASLKIQARTKAPLPDPDEPLDGGSASSATRWQRELDKAREKGDVRAAIEVKKKARKEGFNLE